MRVGLGHMGIRPDDFWGYTLSEWLATIEGYRAKNGGGDSEPMSRSDLNRLMKEHPDGPRNPT